MLQTAQEKLFALAQMSVVLCGPGYIEIRKVKFVVNRSIFKDSTVGSCWRRKEIFRINDSTLFVFMNISTKPFDLALASNVLLTECFGIQTQIVQISVPFLPTFFALCSLIPLFSRRARTYLFGTRSQHTQFTCYFFKKDIDLHALGAVWPNMIYPFG